MAKKFINDKEIISCYSYDLSDDLIGAAVYINDEKVVEHAGIFIRYNGINKIFHSDNGIFIEDIKEDEWYFFKEIMFINPQEVRIFLAHCEIVSDEASVGYDFFYNGNGLFDAANGKYADETGMPQRMSCVGFCLNFLRSYLQREFFYFSDWGVNDNTNDLFNEEYVNSFIARSKKHNANIDEVELVNGIRRIMPIEYITGSFSPDLPVRKMFTDEHFPLVKQLLLEKIA